MGTGIPPAGGVRGNMERGKEGGADLLKSKITDDLVHKIRTESLKINFGKIVLNISPKKIVMEYTRSEQEPEFSPRSKWKIVN
jgi:hypothetical protein